MHREQSLAVGREHETSAGDVSRDEVGTGKRIGCAIQKEQDQFPTLECRTVGGIMEAVNEGMNAGRSDHSPTAGGDTR